MPITGNAMEPKRPIRESEVESQDWYLGTKQEIRGRALSDVGGLAKLGVGTLELPAGCNTKPAHYHTLEEEHLYVLEGTATLYLGDSTYSLLPGTYVCFPAGQTLPHYIDNHSGDVLRYLMIGERIDDDEVIQVNDS